MSSKCSFFMDNEFIALYSLTFLKAQEWREDYCAFSKRIKNPKFFQTIQYQVFHSILTLLYGICVSHVRIEVYAYQEFEFSVLITHICLSLELLYLLEDLTVYKSFQNGKHMIRSRIKKFPNSKWKEIYEFELNEVHIFVRCRREQWCPHHIFHLRTKEYLQYLRQWVPIHL